MLFNDVLGTIGGTPTVRLNAMAEGLPSKVYMKIESANPGGSMKDRAALWMVDAAEADGSLRKGGTIVEPTSGNTGIGLALVAAVRGYRMVVVMPDSMSRERVSMMAAFGAEVVLTPGAEGMAGSVARAEEVAAERGGVVLRQFDNPANPMSHYMTTAKEILEDLPGVDFVVAGIGTGGTATGIGRALRDFSSKARVVGVEPAESPLITQGRAGPHGIQGIGANFVPANYDPSAVAEVVAVSTADAIAAARDLARREGVFAGISSGAAVRAALDLAAREDGAEVLAILPDGGDRYLSTGMFDRIRHEDTPRRPCRRARMRPRDRVRGRRRELPHRPPRRLPLPREPRALAPGPARRGPRRELQGAHAHRRGHPPRRDDRRQLLHRPRHRRGHRRDLGHRRPRHHLPGRDPGRRLLQ